MLGKFWIKRLRFSHRHWWQDFSLVTILVSLSVIIFAQGYQENTVKDARLQAMVEDLNELVISSEELELENERLAEAYSVTATDSAVLENEAWESAVALFTGIEGKFVDYTDRGVVLDEFEEDIESLVGLLVDGSYDELASAVNMLDDEFESAKKAYDEERVKLAAEAEAAAQVASAPVTNAPGAGYSRITVATERGNFVVNLIKVELGGVRVVTVTGNDGNCDNNCNVKPLAQYVAENAGFAGIHGTYFCPPDYGSCAGKVNSYDFPVYSSVHGKWINEDKLFWNGRGMMAFSGSSPRFCADAKSCDRSATAGIVNYPSLINNGNIIVEEGSLPDSLRNVRGFRGAIGVSGSTLYLMIVRGATVPDVAYVMKALGVQNGLNLDGGGSSAMYYNGYIVGPGRALPNAIVLQY